MYCGKLNIYETNCWLLAYMNYFYFLNNYVIYETCIFYFNQTFDIFVSIVIQDKGPGNTWSLVSFVVSLLWQRPTLIVVGSPFPQELFRFFCCNFFSFIPYFHFHLSTLHFDIIIKYANIIMCLYLHVLQCAWFVVGKTKLSFSLSVVRVNTHRSYRLMDGTE